ncbi:phage tail length tape measure family protein, partial [Halomonas sp. ATCHA]|nr:phage tail length tape measure family protein [Halomonas llamarensis]
MNNNLTLSVTLTGDGKQLSGTLRDAQGEVRAFGGTTEREGARAERALEGTGEQAQTVSGHLNKLRTVALGVGAGLAALGGMSFLRGMLDESEQLETNLLRTQQLLETTGRTANRTAEQMHQQARELALGTLESTEGIMAAQQTLLTFRNVAGDTFDEATKAALDMSAALNGDLNSSILQLGKALEDPVRGMTALSRSGTVFTDAQREMVAEMVETNRTAEAQAFILDELAAQYGGVAARETEGLGGAQDTLGQKVQEAKIELADQLNLLERSTGAYKTAAAGVQTLTSNMGLAVDITKGLATVAGTTAVVALGRYTAAQVTANAAMFTGAGAARALSGAMALVGGPLGLLVGAGGLLYMFREELGLVDYAAQNANDALEANTRAIRGGTAAALDASYDNLVNSLEAVSLQAQEAMAQLTELEARQAFYEKSHKGMADSVAGAIGQQTQALAGLWERQVDLQAAIKRNRQEREDATGADRDGVITLKTLDDWLFKTTKSTADLTSGTAKQSKEVTDLTDAYESLLDRITPNRRETVQYARDLGMLNLALASGRMSTQEYMQAMGLLNETFQQSQRESEDLATTVGDEADRMATLYNRQLERMDDASVDMWRSFLDGSEDAFGSFKRLALDTLAEVIHQYTTRQITASLGFNAGGGGMPGTGGGFSGGNLMSMGKNAYNAVTGGVSNIAWTGATPAINSSLGMQGGISSGALQGANSAVGGATSGFLGGSTANFSGMTGLSSMGAGFAGSWGAGEVFGESEAQQIGSTIGSVAGTYIGGPIGAAIGSFLGGGVGSLFGSSPTPFSGRFGTTGTLDAGAEGGGKDGVFEHQNSRDDFYGKSALGFTGFRDRGTQRLQRAGTGSQDWAKELTDAAVRVDNLVASIAQSPQELDAMRDAVQGLEKSSGNAADIVDFALNERPRAALEELGGMFGEFVNSIDGGIEQVVQQAQVAQQAHSVLAGGMERLNLQFDVAGAGAYEAAGNLAQIAGGVENLAAINQGYYQATYTETERLSRSQADLRETLAGVTDQVPKTVGELRALVEAQNLNDTATGELAVRLMKLAPALKQTNDAVRQAIEEQYQESLGRAPDTAGIDYWFNQVAS